MKKTFIPLVVLICLGAAFAIFTFLWMFCRVYVPAGYMAIVTAKTGDDLTPGQILAEKGQKGVQREPLTEGRHFLNPVNTEYQLVPVQTIPVGKVGVVTSKVGNELPAGAILASDTESKGVWKNVLGPGTYRLNPEGYTLTIMDAMTIPIGYVGIVTSQTGERPAVGEFAKAGQQGVMKDVLQPGLYYVNPRAYQVDIVEIGMNQVSIIGRTGSVVLTKSQISNASTALQSLEAQAIDAQNKRRETYLNSNDLMTKQDVQSIAVTQNTAPRNLAPRDRLRSSKSKFESGSNALQETQAKAVPTVAQNAKRTSTADTRSGAVAFGMNQFVSFPSIDGFQILLDMSVEFELLPSKISKIYMLYGDLPAVVEKIILPQILSISRMKGSYYKARDFIDGEGRLKFQNEMVAELIRVLGERHIVVHNAIIRHVEVPDEILSPIQITSMAKEQDLTNKERQNTARKQAELNTQVALVDQLKRQVDQETTLKVATIEAETKRSVAAVAANAKLDVATLDLERAKIQAKTVQCLGEAQVKADFLVSNEQALGEKRRSNVFKNKKYMPDLIFAETMNPNVQIKIVHAGEGTLWTDLKGMAIQTDAAKKTR